MQTEGYFGIPRPLYNASAITMVHYVMKLIAIGDTLVVLKIVEDQLDSILRDVQEEVMCLLTISIENIWLIENQVWRAYVLRGDL